MRYVILLTFDPRLCSPCLDPKLTMKALGMLVNIIHDPDSAESVICTHGKSLLAAMEALLKENPSSDIQEQVLCVLVNVSSSSEKGRNLLIGSDDVMRSVSGVLVRASVCE